MYNLKDVRYIPEMSGNFILVGRHKKSDFPGKIWNEVLKLFKGALVSIKGTRENNIYLTTGEVIRDSDSFNTSTKADDTHKWHKLAYGY